MPTEENIIQISNLKKYFGKVKAVDDISISVNRGEVYGFLGPNGAGKSTTIRCMMDFIKPESGAITLLGADSQEHSAGLKVDIGFLPGEVEMYSKWTGWDHIDFIKKIRGVETSAQELIDRFQFDPSKTFRKLSTGNKQKLGIILAFMHNPELLILDEPTTGLDPLLQNEFYSLLKERASDGATVFMSSHNLAEVEKVCQRVSIIRSGKIIASESIKDLLSKRVYTARVTLSSEIDEAIKSLPGGIKLVSRENGTLVLQVRGDVKILLQNLPIDQVKDIEITHASLEDLFLEHYIDSK